MDSILFCRLIGNQIELLQAVLQSDQTPIRNQPRSLAGIAVRINVIRSIQTRNSRLAIYNSEPILKNRYMRPRSQGSEYQKCASQRYL